MPKFSKKAQAEPLQEAAPIAMDRKETGNLGEPVKPKFAPLSALEQNGKKLDFRRVRRPAAAKAMLLSREASSMNKA